MTTIPENFKFASDAILSLREALTNNATIAQALGTILNRSTQAPQRA